VSEPSDTPPARRFERTELARLRAMRSALLPDGLPERPALEMASCFLPADADVGGDFFVVAGRGECTVFVLGDVVGRGLDAALRAAYVRTLLAGIIRFEQDPARVLTLTNNALLVDSTERTDFITAVCLTYTPSRQEVAWSLAGHPPPLRLDDGSPLGDGELPSPPLGIADDFAPETRTAELPPGAGLLLYTDGVVEARRGDDFYGDDRLGAALTSLRGADPAGLVEGIRDDVQRFAGTEFNDDVCMLALRALATVAEGDAEEVCSPDLMSGFSG
jgi:sigma-B regulation protein RsbU (phosphoserine phosphatase)